MTSRVSLFTVVLVLLGVAAPQLAIAADPPATQAVIARSSFAPIPLKSPPASEVPQSSAALPMKTSSTPLLTVGSSLAIVLGLFAALVWVSRKAAKNSAGNREIPDEALRLLGTKSLGSGRSIGLVRCGRSLLIVGIQASGMQRLGEITDESEVRRLEALCNGDAKASFDQTLAEMHREPVPRGFIGEGVQSTTASQRRKLFAAS